MADGSFVSEPIRRVDPIHCILAFLFNTTALAQLIDISASLFRGVSQLSRGDLGLGNTYSSARSVAGKRYVSASANAMSSAHRIPNRGDGTDPV
jgi:hypothetical protein